MVLLPLQDNSLLIFAAIIAILAKPFSSFFHNRLRFPQGLAIMVTYLLVAALIVIIPLIGYAAWHGYLEAIDSDAFPRHDIGITATPRSA